MKWENVKRTVGSSLRTKILGCYDPEINAIILRDLLASDFKIKSGKSRYEVSEIYADKAYEVIMDWDVRCVGRLRELFPDYFPKSLQKGKLVAYMADNEDCDWMVEKAD